MKKILVFTAFVIMLSYGIYEANEYYTLKDSLFTAVRSNNIEGIKKALNSGITLDARDGVGQTPLHVAAYKSDPGTVKYLLSRGADIEARDKRGGRPLHWAAIKGSIDNAEALIQNGAEINSRDNSGETPLHWAVAGIGVIDVKRFVTASYLLGNHANPNQTNHSGKTPLDIAIHRHDEVMTNLLKKVTKEKPEKSD